MNSMISSETLETMERLGFGTDIDALEEKLFEYRQAAAEGSPIVSDAYYDGLIRILKEVKPESEIFLYNWENDDEEPLQSYDEVLKDIGMCSITTVSNYDEMEPFRNVIAGIGKPVKLIASTKENGHAVRFVYAYGKLVSATTRGRSNNGRGRNVLRHISKIVPNEIPVFKKIPIVEIRGEAIIKKKLFLERFKGVTKTCLSTVTHLMRDSVSDEDIQCLDIVCYKIKSSDNSLPFVSLEQEFTLLDKLGFNTPEHITMNGVTGANFRSSIAGILKTFELKMDNEEIEYDCDGIVVALDSEELFYGTGKDGNAWKGNIAVKMGKYWESNVYESTIEYIEWQPGKKFLVPKAVVEPVVTANGSTVRNVPLYNVGVMERYGYITGSTVYFRYGGEKGVTLVDQFGRGITE